MAMSTWRTKQLIRCYVTMPAMTHLPLPTTCIADLRTLSFNLDVLEHMRIRIA